MTTQLVVLIAEDEECDFELLELALQKNAPDIRIFWLRDGLQVKHYLTSEGHYSDRQSFPWPDLVIADLKMPQVTGLEMLVWLRQNERFRRIPVVIMSSSNQPDDIDRAYALGANAYFLKPTKFETLVQLSQHLIGYWRQAIRASAR